MTVEVIKSKEQPLAEGILLGTWIPNDREREGSHGKAARKRYPAPSSLQGTERAGRPRDGSPTRGPNAPLPRDFGSSLGEKLQSDFNSEGIFDVKPMVLCRDDQVKLPQ